MPPPGAARALSREAEGGPRLLLPTRRADRGGDRVDLRRARPLPPRRLSWASWAHWPSRGLSGGLDRKGAWDSLRGGSHHILHDRLHPRRRRPSLTGAMGYTGIPRSLAAWIGEQGLSQICAAGGAARVLSSCWVSFLDGISIVVLTVSIILPMVLAAGIDPDLVRRVPGAGRGDEPDHGRPWGSTCSCCNPSPERGSSPSHVTPRRLLLPLLVAATVILTVFPQIATLAALDDVRTIDGPSSPPPPDIGPVVSSAHLAESALPALSEVEFALTMMNNAYQRLDGALHDGGGAGPPCRRSRC